MSTKPIAEQTDAERRILTPARIDQGFTTQAQLDAFYATIDHAASCDDCQGTAGSVDVGDGFQPIARRCATWHELDAAYVAS